MGKSERPHSSLTASTMASSAPTVWQALIFMVSPFVLDLVSRNGNERRLLFAWGRACAGDNQVDTMISSPDGRRRCQKQHVERILCLIGVNQNPTQIVGNDIRIAELAHNGGKPQAGSGSGTQQHAKHDNDRDVANRVATTTLASSLGITSHVIATVDLGLRTGR